MTRIELTPGSPRCYCTVCGAVFLTHVSFDLHRGIKASDDELHQDAGFCWSWEQLDGRLNQYEPGVWGTDAEVATALKYKAMREAKNDNN